MQNYKVRASDIEQLRVRREKAMHDASNQKNIPLQKTEPGFFKQHIWKILIGVGILSLIAGGIFTAGLLPGIAGICMLAGAPLLGALMGMGTAYLFHCCKPKVEKKPDKPSQAVGNVVRELNPAPDHPLSQAHNSPSSHDSLKPSLSEQVTAPTDSALSLPAQHTSVRSDKKTGTKPLFKKIHKKHHTHRHHFFYRGGANENSKTVCIRSRSQHKKLRYAEYSTTRKFCRLSLKK